MRRNDSISLIENQRKAPSVFKMTKTRTAMCLVMIIFSCGLVFSLTDAYPTPEPEALPDPEMKLGNNSRLVITHVVKTIEFEVGIIDDDGIVDENSTDPNASEFYETDIQLLNVDLLKEVVNQASEREMEEDERQSSQTVNEEKTLATEGPSQQMQNESLLEVNNSDS